MRTSLSFALASFALAMSLSAQTTALPKDPPKRPDLGARADTNDPEAYWKFGQRQDVSWEKTVDADYWAYRLNPEQTAFLLGMAQALWYKQSPQWRRDYYDGAEYVIKSKDAVERDSLLSMAYREEPFAHIYYSNCYASKEVLSDEDSLWAGLVLEDAGCYPVAVTRLAYAASQHPKEIGIHYNLAQDYYYMQQYDQSLSELNTFLDSLNGRESKKTTFFYQSKPFIYAMMAENLARNGDMAGARDDYGKALVEDLTFYTAHARLSAFALADGDMEHAVSEIDQAVQIAPNNGVLRAQYGDVLLNTTPKRFADAEVQLRKAIELEPYWAQPYYNLGVALEGQKKYADALKEYQEYDRRLPRREVRLQQLVGARISAVQGALASKQ